jgi:hypothetical protein
VIAILWKWIALDEDDARLKMQQLNPSAAKKEERPAYIAMANCVAAMMQQSDQPSSSSSNSPPSTSSSSFFTMLALELSKSLIAEFTQGTSASNAGVSVSMHVRCHSNFEQHVLFNLTSLILTQSLPANLAAINAGVSAGNPVVLDSFHLLHALLSFIDVVLGFPFEDPKRSEKLALQWALHSSESPEEVMIKPSAKWQGVFVTSQLVEMVTHAHHLLSSLSSSSLSFPLSSSARHLARHCLLQLASLHGPILQDPVPQPISVASAPYVRPPGPSQISLSFLTRNISSLTSLLDRCLSSASVSPVGKMSEEQGLELIGMAEIMKRLLWPGSLASICACPDTSGVQKLLQLQHALSLFLLPYVVTRNLGGKHVQQTDTSKTECFDILLDNWSTLISQLSSLDRDDFLSSSSNPQASLNALEAVGKAIQECTGGVFQAYVTQRCRAQDGAATSSATDADDSDDDDDSQFLESSYVDSHLADVAMLGKAYALDAVKLIVGEMKREASSWQFLLSHPSSSSPSPSLFSLHESLYFLFKLTAHFVGSGDAGWKEMDKSTRYAAIPSHILHMLSSPSGFSAWQELMEVIVGLAGMVREVLEYKENGVSRPMKEFCSPLVLSSFLSLLQTLLATGYIALDQSKWEEKEVSVAFLQAYSGGNSTRMNGSMYGSHVDSLLSSLHLLSISFLTHYTEEFELIEGVLDLLELGMKHTTVRGVWRRILCSPPSSPPSPFRLFFLHSFMSQYQTDPFSFLSVQQGGQGKSYAGWQGENCFASLQPMHIVRLTNLLVQILSFKSELDCNDLHGPSATQEKKRRMEEAMQMMQAWIAPVMRNFFSILHSPSFSSHKSSPLLLSFLSSYLSFFTGLTFDDTCPEWMDFMWMWCTASEKMVGLNNQAGVEAQVKELGRFLQQQEVGKMRGGGGGGGEGKQNLLDTFIELIKQYNTDDILLSDDSGSTLSLCSSILLFFRCFTESFLPYLNQVQSFSFMQKMLEVVNTLVQVMQRRADANTLALQKKPASSQREAESLHAKSALLETAEWEILHSLLQLLECISSKDRFDLSIDSVEFASDAVLNGLMLLLPRLTGNMMQRPNVAKMFFGLLSELVTTNPDKLASVLNEGQRNQLLQVISFVFDSEIQADATAAGGGGGGKGRSVLAVSSSAQLHTELLKEACSAVQAISQYHLYFVSGKAEMERQEAAKVMQQRGLRDIAPPPPSPFAPACVVFLRSLLRVLLHAHLSAALLDPLADALLPTILAQPPVFLEQVREILEGWKQAQIQAIQRLQQSVGQDAAMSHQRQMESMQSALESGFQQLVPSSLAQAGVTGSASRTYFSSKTMAVERSQRTDFRRQMREFVLTVRPLITVKTA